MNTYSVIDLPVCAKQTVYLLIPQLSDIVLETDDLDGFTFVTNHKIFFTTSVGEWSLSDFDEQSEEYRKLLLCIHLMHLVFKLTILTEG